MTFAATIKNCFISTPHTFLSSNTIHTSYSTDRLLDIRPRTTMDQAGNMARLILSFLMMLLLAVEIQATIVLTPAPQPQPPNTFSMYGATPGSLHPQECGTRCTTRCSKTAFKKPCMFFCQKCCAKCLCVPPGTYGNKQLCPCYNNWKTKRGGPKCP